jgi:hypothetical protein
MIVFVIDSSKKILFTKIRKLLINFIFTFLRQEHRRLCRGSHRSLLDRLWTTGCSALYDLAWPDSFTPG